LRIAVREFYEFFAGGGMARAGLGKGWSCRFANDFDPKKAASYAANWGDAHLKIGDVAKITSDELQGTVDLAWASFPCQDLSLAGAGAGLKGERSGTFWPFWRLMTSLDNEGRAPRAIGLENVCGALTSHDGKDFAAIGSALAEGGYRFGAVVIDAAHFVPHSRPRLFIIAVQADHELYARVVGEAADPLWHSAALLKAHAKLTPSAKDAWVWWRLPAPSIRNMTFADLIEDDPVGVAWREPQETAKLLAMMSDVNLDKVAEAKRAGHRMVGAVYKRTRFDAAGGKVQRAEIRFDVAGCLRTPAGGSSRQTVVVVDGKEVRSRLISPRETARLMGLAEDYVLPKNYNEAYHLTGDGVAVPVVRHLAEHLLEPLLDATQPRPRRKVAA
jgi:DNA (cytosine-5)-methyltransferase 1